ncbi:MAG TPA: hypothetical protein VFI49_15775, partial [Rudaea sp.]|nr:hypothetical protein [Rudaea sp.]
AIAGAARFSSVWEFDDFWKRSNTFHGFLRFVDAVEQKWGKSGDDLKPMRDLRSEMIGKNGPYFDRAIGGDGVWADDYGWCGISCLAAQDYLRSIGDDSAADMYLDRAERCWQWMTQTGYDGTDAATPVKHGCGNTSPERRKASGTYGTRNTVTNVNLLLLSLRLYAATKKSDYLSMAWSQYQWFSAWMTIEYKSLDDGRYVRQIGLGPTYALIHERPMAEDTYVETSDPGWERGWLWSGDQGLLMAAMAEVVLMQNDFRQFPGFDPAFARDKCNYIAAGIEHYLFGKDAVLREAPFRAAFNPPPPNVNYANDYVGGRGVLLRYASEASVRQARKTTFNLDGVRKTAAAVWDSRVSPNQFTPLWNSAGDAAFNAGFVAAWGTGVSTALTWKIDAAQLAGVLQANGLDAITAAIRAS